MSLKFAWLCHFVDKKQPVPHSVGFESFPFVVYNMYSGHIDDWHHYEYIRIEADGKPLKLTDLPFLQGEQIMNPLAKFLDLQSQNFNEDYLYSFLLYDLDSSKYAKRIFDRVSNQSLINNKDAFRQWLQRYLSTATGTDIHEIKVFDCHYQYNDKGYPEKMDEQLAYQYPPAKAQ